MVMSFKGKDILREWKPNENFNEFIEKRTIHFQSIFLNKHNCLLELFDHDFFKLTYLSHSIIKKYYSIF